MVPNKYLKFEPRKKLFMVGPKLISCCWTFARASFLRVLKNMLNLDQSFSSSNIFKKFLSNVYQSFCSSNMFKKFLLNVYQSFFSSNITNYFYVELLPKLIFDKYWQIFFCAEHLPELLSVCVPLRPVWLLWEQRRPLGQTCLADEPVSETWNLFLFLYI